MIIKTALSLAFAAACLATIATAPAADAARRTVVVKHLPIVNPDDLSASWSPQQNVIDSKRYERLLETNSAFRQARMRRSAARSAIRNSVKAVSRASIKMSRTSARRRRPAITGATPGAKVSA
jgi:hypothetical protein